MKDETKKPLILTLLPLILLVTFTLACALIPNFDNIGDQVKEQVLETVSSVSTEAVGNIQLTAEAMLGEMGPQIEATLAAIPPDINIGEAPTDIPVTPRPLRISLEVRTRYFYMTTVSLEEAVQFLPAGNACEWLAGDRAQPCGPEDGLYQF